MALKIILIVSQQYWASSFGLLKPQDDCPIDNAKFIIENGRTQLSLRLQNVKKAIYRKEEPFFFCSQTVAHIQSKRSIRA